MTPSPPAPSSADPVKIREKKENAPGRSLFLHLPPNVARAFLRTGPRAGRCGHRPLRRSIGKQCVGAEPCPPHWQSIRRGRCLHRPAPPYFLQPVIARAQSARGNPFFFPYCIPMAVFRRFLTKRLVKEHALCYTLLEKQKCGSSRVRQHPRACAGDLDTYTTANRPHRMEYYTTDRPFL